MIYLVSSELWAYGGGELKGQSVRLYIEISIQWLNNNK